MAGEPRNSFSFFTVSADKKVWETLLYANSYEQKPLTVRMLLGPDINAAMQKSKVTRNEALIVKLLK